MSPQAVPGPEHRARWGPATGVAFAVILAVSLIVLNNTPDTNKSPAYLLAWYNVKSHQNHLKINLLLTDIAVVLGIFWFGYLRDRWGRTDLGARLSPVLLVGAGIFATGGLISNGAELALFDSPKHLTPDAVQALNWKYPVLVDTYREGTRGSLGRSPLCPVLIRLSSVKGLSSWPVCGRNRSRRSPKISGSPTAVFVAGWPGPTKTRAGARMV
jgi:hypothetical protein